MRDDDYPDWECECDHDYGYDYEMAYEGYGCRSDDEDDDSENEKEYDSEGGKEDDSEGEETGKEEALNGPVIMHLTIPKPKEEVNSTNATTEPAAAGSGKISSRGSGLGPDLETEAKMVSDLPPLWNLLARISHNLTQILRSHRSKPY